MSFICLMLVFLFPNHPCLCLPQIMSVTYHLITIFSFTFKEEYCTRLIKNYVRFNCMISPFHPSIFLYLLVHVSHGGNRASIVAKMSLSPDSSGEVPLGGGPRCSQASWEMFSLLALAQCLLSVGCAWYTSKTRCPGGIIRCPDHRNWLLSVQRSSDSRPSRALLRRVSPATLRRQLILAHLTQSFRCTLHIESAIRMNWGGPKVVLENCINTPPYF